MEDKPWLEPTKGESAKLLVSRPSVNLTASTVFSTDGKLCFGRKGCFDPRTSPADHVNSFCTYHFYVFPALSAFSCEFMHYYTFMVNTMITEPYECINWGTHNYVDFICKTTDKEIDSEVRAQLQTQYVAVMSRLDVAHKMFKEKICEVAGVEVADDEIERMVDDPAAEDRAKELVEALLTLLAEAFFCVAARVMIGWLIVKRDEAMQLISQCPLAKLGARVLENPGESPRAALDALGKETCPDLWRKNMGDERVVEFLGREDLDPLKCETHLFLATSLRCFFEDFVVHMYHTVSTPSYCAAHARIRETFDQNQISERKKRKAQDDDEEEEKTATEEENKIEEEDKQTDETTKKGTVAIPEESADHVYGKTELSGNLRDNALAWFVERDALRTDVCEERERAALDHRPAEFERIRRMIEEILNKYQ